MFPALLGFVVGSALQLQQTQLWDWPIYVAFVLLAPVGYAGTATKYRASLQGSLVMFGILAGVGFGFGLTGLRATLYLHDTLEPGLEGRDVLVTGVVANLPQRNEAGVRFRLALESAQLDEQELHLPARLDVAWYGGAFPAESASALATPLLELNRLPADVRAGERWRLRVRLKAPHGSRNPHGFDYELWLWEQGVQATGYVRAGAKDPPPERLGQTWRYPVALARQVVRERIFSHLGQHQPAGMLAALVVGDQNAIDRADWDVFRATGVAHLVSISGLHITMFAWGAAGMIGWLWCRSGRLCLAFPAPFAALLGGCALACAYAIFSGWGVPAQRTCLMLATVALLRLSGARWPWPHIWMLACAVVVASDPWALLQSGFWLSFVAVGILFATDFKAHPAHSISARGIIGKIFSNLREQWVITISLAPLSLLLFGQISLVGLVANALAIPWITLVVTPLAMLGVCAAPLWDMATTAIGWLLLYLQWLAALPWATLTLAIPPLWVAVVGMLGGLVLVMPWPWSVRVLGVPLLVPLVLWRSPVPPVGQFELLAADIGQGNAVLVRSAGHALLFDAGPRYSLESDAGHRVLVPLLQAMHTRLDRVILSHRDTDHVGGAAAVLAMHQEAQLLSSMEPEHLLQSLRPAQRCLAGQHWEWDGVQFDILHPQLSDYDLRVRPKPNAMSCVLRISNGKQTALLVGDIEQAQEARLIASAAPLKADVLLVPHHGSKTSSSAAFLDAVAPRLAIVQAAYRNRFSHPASVVVQRYHERNIAVFDSPHCGAFTWQSWQPWRREIAENEDCFRKQALRYWHHRVP
ncbi:MAG: DNA internalization-related competence protein ComEC/Rec2 [Rhodoferax sp.]|nr:DNA internalization-related competence protein ComEC/Rec2 [Rhodoferax sp.]